MTYQQSESADTTQIGPEIPITLKQAFKWAVEKRNDGKYRGRMSGDVTAALELFLGFQAKLNPEWWDDMDDVDGEDLTPVFEDCVDRFDHAVQTVNRDRGTNVATSDDIAELKQEIEMVNTTSINMMRQILNQVEEQSDGPSEEHDNSNSSSAQLADY